MRLSLKADLTYRFDAPSEVLLLIEAAHSADQAVRAESLILSPDTPVSRLDDPHTGERRAVFLAHGHVDIRYQAEVEVPTRDADLADLPATAIRDLPAGALPYLRPSCYCPSNRFQAFVQRQFGRLQGGAKVAAMIDWIAGHVEYCPGVSDSSTTALDTYVDRAGVCRDFTHLLITFCRAADIPARAVSAYAWKLDPPDLHAVVEVYLGGRWRIIDATRKAPVETLVRIATGHDAADIAFMTIFGRADLVSQRFEVKPSR